MFEKYDEAARRAIYFARYEAYMREYNAIAPEHLLLGIVREEERKPSDAWPPGAPPVSEVRIAVERRCWPWVAGAGQPDIPLTAESKRVLAAASQGSERLAQSFVGVGHLILGLITFRPLGWTLLGVRFSVKRYLRRSGLKVESVEAHVRGLKPATPTLDAQPASSPTSAKT